MELMFGKKSGRVTPDGECNTADKIEPDVQEGFKKRQEGIYAT